MTLLANYWPTKAEIQNCIKREAESASEAVLLAVHQPMPLTVRNARSMDEAPVSERDFLEAFLTEDLPEGTLIQAVTGPSGAGKSHLIRWLASQLERDPRAKERMHVIRIPKAASLRLVVERILEPLAGDPEFAEARDEVRKVVAEVSPRDGAIRLAAGLKIALNQLSDRLERQILADPHAPTVRDRKLKLFHARELPHYFNDPAIEAHFTNNIFSRIISRAVGGQGDEDAPLPQFAPQDLMPPDGVSFGESSAQVRRYFQTGLNTNEGYVRAADVLNDKVLDQAIGEVFRLGQALGGVTLSDLVMHIRALLLRQGRELVLLIEDFAALAGIQEALLSVCIKEGIQDGRQICANMRTALAVTDGYLQDRDTVLTRARREWIVKTELRNDDDVLARAIPLIAGYLNAARWGEAELTRHFHAHAAAASLTGWLPPYRDETLTDDEAEILEAFGRCGDVPLFPYSETAITTLARRHLAEGGRLRFQPRKILNTIVKDVLDLRDDYEAGIFPPRDFQGGRPNAEVAAWLGRTIPAAETRERMASVIAHWAGNPTNVEDIAATPDGIFKAFLLPAPASLGLTSATQQPAVPRSRQSPAASAPTGGSTSPPKGRNAQPSEDPEAARRRQKLDGVRQRLEDWTRGTLLPQADAGAVRNTINALLMKAVDWNTLRLAKAAAPRIFISIPKAAGEERSTSSRDIRLRIAESHEDHDGRLRRSLMAIMAYQLHNNSWKYDDGDVDSAIAATFIERLAALYSDEAEKKITEEIAGTADLLLKQARAMGTAGRSSNQPETVAKIALAAAPAVEPSTALGTEEQRWQQLRTEVSATRPQLQSLLLERMACFQGATRANAHAVDLIRLEEALSAEQKSLPKETEANPLQSHVQNLEERRLRHRALPLAQELSQFASHVRGAIGESFSKEDYLREAKQFLDAAESANVWPRSHTKRSIATALEEFRATPLLDALHQIERVPTDQLDSAPLETLLAIISHVDLGVVARTRSFLKTMGEFLDAVDREAVRLEQIAQSADPEPKRVAIEARLSTIEATLLKLADA